MNMIREQLNRPLVVGIAAFVIGLLIGWLAIGWGLWPVTYVNASPEHLHERAQEEYLRMSIEAFGYNGDVEKAQQRFSSLGENGPVVLQKIIDNPQGQNPDLIQTFSASVGYSPGTVSPAEPTGEPTQEGGTSEEGKSPLSSYWPVFCLVGLIVVAAAAYFVVTRIRQSQAEFSSSDRPIEPEFGVTTWEEGEEGYEEFGMEEETPIGRFMASYKLGDDFFDDSFSIDSPSGEFLGECGVSISETIGFGEPKKVTAFEVWLFDKNDIQTVTKVLMSDHAFNLDELKQKLMIKGEPILVQPGVETSLDTESLRMTVRVIDLAYGHNGLPEKSYFDQFVLELTIWLK